MNSLAENLLRERKKKGLSQTALAEKAGVAQQLVSQIERGINQSTKELPALAAVLGVSVSELDQDYDIGLPSNVRSASIPVISWVSAGTLVQPDVVLHPDDSPLIEVAGLDAAGDWIALRVESDSMDRISPPESIILVNRRDRQLVANACYVIADSDGKATYKRFRANPKRFEPVSTNPAHEPIFPDNDPQIVGRVRMTVLRM